MISFLSLSQIDEWLEYAPTISCGSEFENACSYMDAYLEKHTFFVSHYFSIADIAIWAGLAGKLQNSSFLLYHIMPFTLSNFFLLSCMPCNVFLSKFHDLPTANDLPLLFLIIFLLEGGLTD